MDGSAANGSSTPRPRMAAAGAVASSPALSWWRHEQNTVAEAQCARMAVPDYGLIGSANAVRRAKNNCPVVLMELSCLQRYFYVN